MINPFELTEKVSKIISRNGLKKYYRFRKTRFYGGCATADCLGCNLRCVYCWAQKKVWYPEKFGKYYSPKNVSENLINMNLPLVRVSGGEPTICKYHLIKLIENIPDNKLFILETNGILLNEDYINLLSNFRYIYVRVSLKGVNENTFEKITNVSGKYFKNQVNALTLLEKYGIKHRAAILIDIFTNEQIKSLNIPDLEYESLIRYPFVMISLKKRGISVIRK